MDFEVERDQTLLDPHDPVEHFYQVRDIIFEAGRFKTALLAPIGRNFPPTVLLRSLFGKESVPLLLEWPEGFLPSVALQCQFVLLLALAGERAAASKLAEQLAPIVLGGFWTLWTLEKEYKEAETRLSCALFLCAIGYEDSCNTACPHEAAILSPFFAYLSGLQKLDPSEVVAKLSALEKLMILAPIVRGSLLTRAVLTNAHPVEWVRRNDDEGGQKDSFAGAESFAIASSGRGSSRFAIQIPITSSDMSKQIIWTVQGSRAGLGAVQIGSVRVLAFGPHAYPLNDPRLFGVAEAGAEWFCSSAQKEVWFQIQQETNGFSLYSVGISCDRPMAFAFYIKAGECRVAGGIFKPNSLRRFVGEALEVDLDGVKLFTDRPLNIELIPLAGDSSYWGATFLLAFWLPPLSNKVFFRWSTDP